MTLELSTHLKEHLPARDTFDAVMRLDGEVFREHKHRRTVRAEIGGRGYFVKVHRHTGWAEILKNVLRGRMPTLTARPEVQAIRTLEALGVPTVRLAGFGVRGGNPARLESFIITEALEGFVHLDAVVRDSLEGRNAFALKRAIISETAAIARALHRHGINHRDFYLCHFMLPQRDFATVGRDEAIRLHVIDLHRAQRRRTTPRRWIAKDLSGLLFSSLDAPLTATDCARFLRAYWGAGWRDRVDRDRRFLRHIIRRAAALYRSEHGRSPRLPAGLSSF